MVRPTCSETVSDYLLAKLPTTGKVQSCPWESGWRLMNNMHNSQFRHMLHVTCMWQPLLLIRMWMNLKFHEYVVLYHPLCLLFLSRHPWSSLLPPPKKETHNASKTLIRDSIFRRFPCHQLQKHPARLRPFLGDLAFLGLGRDSLATRSLPNA